MSNSSCHRSLCSTVRALTISANYEQEGTRREVNILQKEIGTIKKAKGDASELLAKKAVLDKKIADLTTSTAELVKKRDKLAARIGNIVDPKCHVSLTEVSPYY